MTPKSFAIIAASSYRLIKSSRRCLATSLFEEIAYFENGVIEYIGNRNREGHIHGDFIKYYRNGNIEIEGQLDNGYRDGEWEVYNESGVLLEKINYSMGEIIDSETY